MSLHLIRGLSHDPDSGGYVIEFLTPTADIRASGLVLNHALLIPREDPFDELLDDLELALQLALEQGLALLAASDPAELTEEPDDTSAFDNPLER